MSNIRIFTGNSNLPLSEKIADLMDRPLGKANIGTFSDGEISVEIKENVRGRDIFLVQSTCAPCNDNLVEMLVMADAFRRASTASLTAVMPYFGYARQDRRVRSARVPITAKVVADMISKVGFSRLITVDLHAEQIQGFFDIPVDNVYSTRPLLEDMQRKKLKHPMIVSPDVGGVMRARAIAKRLNDVDLAIIDKRRPQANQVQVMNVIGDVSNKDCIIVDDIVDTAGTLCNAAATLKENGACTVTAYATHPVLSGPAIENLEASALDELVVFDSIPLSQAALNCRKIRQLSLASLIAETISRINEKASVSSMFE
ncbi:MAG: ribose-phosphate pyrophosphokinase [Gammaproteobacteria bacterium RIFCSPHIGHO2_12_FULL_41_15]|nr:MAG: ribose-phosphate pyrophosphokinase [Gammaproteobacteria bacterium RIFCSPHIGHO2_12_FULL_41_15]